MAVDLIPPRLLPSAPVVVAVDLQLICRLLRKSFCKSTSRSVQGLPSPCYRLHLLYLRGSSFSFQWETKCPHLKAAFRTDFTFPTWGGRGEVSGNRSFACHQTTQGIHDGMALAEHAFCYWDEAVHIHIARSTNLALSNASLWK